MHHGHEPLELGLQLGVVARHLVPRKPQAVGQLGRQGHPPSHPCGVRPVEDLDMRTFTRGLEGGEGDGLAGEDEGVAFLEGGDEGLLHVAQQPDALELHRDHGGADDGAHAHPVPAGLGPVAHDPATFLVLGDALVLGVGAKGGAPGGDEVHGLAPVVAPSRRRRGGQHGRTGVRLVEPVPHARVQSHWTRTSQHSMRGTLGSMSPCWMALRRAPPRRARGRGWARSGPCCRRRGGGRFGRRVDHARDALGTADLDDRIHG